jgi:succinate dehydrogenase flavin-adding protein (antitoxin of CptAB toxin-antitoxin module)
VDDRIIERLKWKSRRGLLELDIVFDRFWKGAGTTMDAAEVAALETLLALPDNDLLDLVMGRTAMPEARLRPVLDKLRAAEAP